jgi:hypothetical protein
MAEAKFSIQDEFRNYNKILEGEFKKRGTKFNIILDANVPKKVKASQMSFRQIIWNLI